MIKGMLKILAIPVMFTVLVVMNASGDGIYPINSNAVYMLGDGCTINNTLNRSLQDMERDFEECLRYHAAWQFLENYEGYPEFEW